MSSDCGHSEFLSFEDSYVPVEVPVTYRPLSLLKEIPWEEDGHCSPVDAQHVAKALQTITRRMLRVWDDVIDEEYVRLRREERVAAIGSSLTGEHLNEQREDADLIIARITFRLKTRTPMPASQFRLKYLSTVQNIERMLGNTVSVTLANAFVTSSPLFAGMRRASERQLLRATCFRPAAQRSALVSPSPNWERQRSYLCIFNFLHVPTAKTEEQDFYGRVVAAGLMDILEVHAYRLLREWEDLREKVFEGRYAAARDAGGTLDVTRSIVGVRYFLQRLALERSVQLLQDGSAVHVRGWDGRVA